MAGNDSWIYQGRQYHMWFGSGRKPADARDGSAAASGMPALQDRIHSLGHTMAAGLPPSKRHHRTARLTAAEHGRLDRVMTGVVHALPLGRRLIPIRVLGTTADAPGVNAFVEAGAVIGTARTLGDLREATDLVGRSAQEMGLDHFPAFVGRADDHLTRSGGLITLVRDLPGPPAPTVPGSTPSLPRGVPPGPLTPMLRLTLGTAGLLATAQFLTGLAQQAGERQVRDAIERFGLDPSKPADVTAAVAYRWAQSRGPFRFDTPQTGPLMEAMAERVMRAVRADPALFEKMLAEDRAALAILATAARGDREQGFGYEIRSDEERELVNSLTSEGKSGAEIQDALERFRAIGRRITTEVRRNTPGDVFASRSLERAEGPWLSSSLAGENGAAIPGQVADKLVGRSFGTVGLMRQEIWRLIANDPELAMDFSPRNRRLMRDGNAPYPPKKEQVIIARTGRFSNGTWELHHDPSLMNGGRVYDLG